MSGPGRLIPYPERRAIEDTAYAQQAMPTRIFAILLPVWRVEIRATVTEGEDYELIDRYLERAIATAGLETAGDLADFFGLDVVVVDRALRALAAIGHLTGDPGRIALTDIGHRSVRDGIRYVVTRQDRRVLYFDGFGSRPLTRFYYDARAVSLMTASAAAQTAASQDWPRFTALVTSRGLRPDALAELARHPDRAHFNLPERIDNPEILSAPEIVFLPAYLVRAIASGGQVRLFAYSQAGDKADPFLTGMCEQTLEISALIETEHASGGPRSDARARRWLGSHNLDASRLQQLPGGLLRVTLPAASFGGDAALAISDVGSYRTISQDILHLWCGDLPVRRQALLERLDTYLSRSAHPNPAAASALISQLSRQLELGEVTLPRLRQMAADAGKAALAVQVAALLRA